jgi:transposase
VGDALPQQTQRWLKAGVFEEMIHDLRVLLRLSKDRSSEPTAATVDSRTLRSTPESGHRGGYDGHKKGKKGSKVHAAVDTLGHLLALRVSPANEDDRKEVEKLSEEIQRATGENVELAYYYVDQGYTGERTSGAAAEHGIRLEVVKHEEAKRGFLLLPRRWVVERDFAWASRFWRLVKDYERLPETVAGLHFVAFACLFLQRAAGLLSAGS